MDTDFDPLMLDKSMPQSAQEAILMLMRAWPLFEIALTDWLIAVAGMTTDIGTLMVGRMDTRGKIDKLKEIYSHLGNKEQVQWLTNLNKSARRYTVIRNIVVHSIYLGHKPDPKQPEEYQLIFSNHRPIKGRRKSIGAVVVKLHDIKRTANFAGSAASKIIDALRKQPV
jgi:hypothetical protein